MARPPRQPPPPGAGWEYVPSTRGWRNVQTGKTLSRRQYDERYGRLRAQGFRTNEAQARAHREAGAPLGPARGRKGQRLERLFPILAYHDQSPLGWRRVEGVAVNKRTASLLGEYWARLRGEVAEGVGDPAAFKRQFDRRIIRDRSTGERYRLVGDIDLIQAGFNSLSDTEQAELWEVIYERRWSTVA